MSNHNTKCPQCGGLIGLTAQPLMTETCPECYGRGYVTDYYSCGDTHGISQRPCSRGCPMAYTINIPRLGLTSVAP